MSVSVTMPRLGESVTEGTVTRWLKAEGDTVEADEPLLEVSTDKVDTEVPSPASGTLLSIKVAEDETVEIGVELAVIGDAAEGSGGGDSAGGGDAAPAPEAQPEPEPEPEPAPEPQQPQAAPQPAAPQPVAQQPAAQQQPATQTDYAPPADVP
ncbi:biotin/lipoyl-containing protein, partial [Jatrophihabitans sp. YIM 134969]